MKEALTNLLKVKSIISILLTLVVCYLAVIQVLDIKEIYIMIISFYFGTQYEKREQAKREAQEDQQL